LSILTLFNGLRKSSPQTPAAPTLANCRHRNFDPGIPFGKSCEKGELEVRRNRDTGMLHVVYLEFEDVRRVQRRTFNRPSNSHSIEEKRDLLRSEWQRGYHASLSKRAPNMQLDCPLTQDISDDGVGTAHRSRMQVLPLNEKSLFDVRGSGCHPRSHVS